MHKKSMQQAIIREVNSKMPLIGFLNCSFRVHDAFEMEGKKSFLDAPLLEAVNSG